MNLVYHLILLTVNSLNPGILLSLLLPLEVISVPFFIAIHHLLQHAEQKVYILTFFTLLPTAAFSIFMPTTNTSFLLMDESSIFPVLPLTSSTSTFPN